MWQTRIHRILLPRIVHGLITPCSHSPCNVQVCLCLSIVLACLSPNPPRSGSGKSPLTKLIPGSTRISSSSARSTILSFPSSLLPRSYLSDAFNELSGENVTFTRSAVPVVECGCFSSSFCSPCSRVSSPAQSPSNVGGFPPFHAVLEGGRREPGRTVNLAIYSTPPLRRGCHAGDCYNITLLPVNCGMVCVAVVCTCL